LGQWKAAPLNSLKDLQEVTIVDNGEKIKIRTEAKGVCSTVFKAVGMALPPTIQKVNRMKM